MISIGNKPKYMPSSPSTFMKGIEEEIRANKLRDAENNAEMAQVDIDELKASGDSEALKGQEGTNAPTETSK
jgi:hypothetical protein